LFLTIPGEPTMFQRFLKARSVVNFRARSASRNTETDRTRVSSIFRSLEGAKAEQAGLKARIDDSVARSAVTLGNDSDEYLTRDPVDDHYQNLLGTEMAEGQRRLTELEVTMTHIQFLKKELVTRFPGFDFGHGVPDANVSGSA
jgi:hypothetical protein